MRRIYKFLDLISRKLGFASLYLEMKDHLISVMKGKSNSYFKNTKFLYRGIGKTRVLIMLSARYDLPICVKSKGAAKRIEQLICYMYPQKNYKHKPRVLILSSNMEFMEGRRFEVVLVDEGLTAFQINVMSACSLGGIIGYIEN